MAPVRRAFVPLVPLAPLALAACATTAPEPRSGSDGVAQLAERLVLAAQERTDLRPLRVWVADVHPTDARAAEAAAAPPADPIANRLQQELVLALAMRMNVVDSGIAPELEPAATPASIASTTLLERAAARGATHVVLGEYLRRDDVLLTTVRLVDTESRLIVAAARGDVRLGTGGLAAIAAPAPEPRVRPATRVVAAEPTAPAPAPTVAAAAPAPAPRAEPATKTRALTRAETSPMSLENRAGWPIEDFETWYARRLAEQEADAARRGEAPAPVADEEAAEAFPWRRHAWLSRLLKIPETSSAPR